MNGNGRIDLPKYLRAIRRYLDDLGVGGPQLRVSRADAVGIDTTERARESAGEPTHDVGVAAVGSEIDCLAGE